ncbi:hypothetical protein CLOM_g20445, partial [Closterium sp. NIES-68]
LTKCYFWPDMQGDVQWHMVSCKTCQPMKSSKQKPTGQLPSIPPPERVWQQVTMDFITRLPAKDGCNDAIFVVVDKLAKMAHFAAYKKGICAEETACLFISTFDTRLQFSSAYHRAIDGQTKRANQTMEKLIRTTCDGDGVADGEQQLPLIKFAYNKASSATTRHSPFYLNYGHNSTVPIMPNIENPIYTDEQ